MQTRRLATLATSPSSLLRSTFSPQSLRRLQQYQQTPPQPRWHVGTTRTSPFTPASSSPHLLAQDILSRSLTLSDTPPSKVDFANQQIAIAKEVGQTLCNDALAALRSSFSPVLASNSKSSKSAKSRTSDRAADRRLRDAPSPSGPYSAPIPGQL